MTEEIDIWRAANLLVKRHDADAEIAAAQRADELLAEDDVEGQLVWRRIVATITEPRRSQPAKDERLI